MTFNFRRIMSNMNTNPGGRLMARDGALDDDALRAAVPSIFATEAHESRSARFAPVPTIDVLNGLRKEGFEPFFAQQARTRDESRRDFTKHMLRLRHRGLQNAAGQVFEIILVNANDGSAAYHMIPGFFRFVCTNGLMVGDTFEDVKVRHSGDAIGDVIEGAYKVLEDAPRVCDQVQRFQGLKINDQERLILAEAAHVLRFGDDPEKAAPIKADRLILPRRTEDRATDLWTAFNVVQENVIRGGQRARVTAANGARRNVTVREVAGIDQNRALNRALWTLTERMAEIKAAA
jgi:hypothetical protein